MVNIINDDDYYNIVEDILDNEDFKALDLIEHHGTTRLEHSIRVSYNSYKLAKRLNLHTYEVARAGLLHDFFMSYSNRSMKQRFISTFTHPKYALANAEEAFKLNDLERNIIRSHMFPINICFPKYSESWLVSSVDKAAGIYEFVKNYSFILKYATNYLFLLTILSLSKLH